MRGIKFFSPNPNDNLIMITVGAAKRNLSKDPSEEQAPCGKTLRRSKKATSELKDPVVSVEGSQPNVDASINESVMESEVATPEASTALTERRLTARQVRIDRP